jgi:DNA-binding transcriptional ArsR family regulator
VFRVRSERSRRRTGSNPIRNRTRYQRSRRLGRQSAPIGPFARPTVRYVPGVEGTHEGQSAAEIADRALVSEPTARRHCEALVNTGFAETEQDGRTTLYRRDPDRVLATRIRELREELTHEELLEGIERMKTEIRGYQEAYDVLSPEELARELDAVAQAALAYDEASHQLTA